MGSFLISTVNKMAQHDMTPEPAKDGLNAPKNGRRRFLGVGTAAAPFVLTLVSQPALGVTCFSPSRALSKNTSLSQQAKDSQCTGAQSPGNYSSQQTAGSSSYSWPASVPPTTPFHPTFLQGTVPGQTSFTKLVGVATVSQSMGEVVGVNGNGGLVKHILAAYLNKKGGHGAVIPDQVLTEAAILNIWKEFVTNGYYTPVTGTKWFAADIVSYLLSNGIVI